MNYKAFISYSHSADDKLAPALQSALHRFAKPFYRLRAIRVFRDKTSLHLTPELWPLIQKALADSEYFLLLCSPGAASSHWVQNEVTEWLRLRGNADKLLLVLTEGEMVWDDAAGDFDWQRTNALPPNLRNVFHREPLYSDLRWARKATDLSLRNPQFLDEIGSLGATLHGRSKDEMIGADVRQHRLFKTLSAAAIVLLLALTAAASGTAFYAVKQRNEAVRQTLEADRQRHTAVEAADRERQAADRERKAAASEKIARENEEKQRKQAERATENEKTAKNQAESRRREAERQREIADDRRREAERQQNLATSRELAASADSQLGADPELSVLLSMAAHERTATEEAASSLRRALLRSHVRATFRYLSWFKSAVYSPDGKWLILVKDRAEVIETGTWRVIKTLERPTQWSSVSSVSLNRDGTKALTISHSLENKQSTVRVWETNTWRLIADLHVADNDQLAQAVLSPDGTLFGTWSTLEIVPRIWNIRTGQATALGSEKTRVGSLVFSPDSKFVLTLGSGEARVWEAMTGKLVSRAPCGSSSLFSGGAFSVDGKYVALSCEKEAYRDGEIGRIIDPNNGQTIADLRGHARYITSATFSPDGKWLVTTSADKTARVWQVGTWQSVAVLRGHTGDVKGAKFNGAASVLVTLGRDGLARVWQSGSWNELGVLQGHNKPLIDVAVSFDGRHVVTFATDSSARVWEIDVGEGLATIDGFAENGGGSASPTAYSPDGKLFVTRTNGGLVQVRELATDRVVGELGRGNFLAFSPDGKKVFTSGPEYVVQMFDTQTWQKAGELRGHKHEVLNISFSRDGKWVVTAGGYDNTARVWETDSGKNVAVLQGHTWRVMRAMFSPDNRWIGTASYDKTARVWEVGTWREVAVLRGHANEVVDMAFSSDGRRIVTASYDQTARLWETGTWREIATLHGHTDQVTDASFSPDSRLVLTASWDKTARLWDAEAGEASGVLSGHTNMVNSACFSPDGRLVATAGDTTVRVWDVRSRNVITVLPIATRGLDSSGSEVTARAVNFSPNGKFLTAASSDGITRIYSWELFAPIEDVIALARTRVTRDLTSEEKQMFLHQAPADDPQRARPQ